MSRTISPLGVAALVALAATACEPTAPTEPLQPQLAVGVPGVVPQVEYLTLCKVGPSTVANSFSLNLNGASLTLQNPTTTPTLTTNAVSGFVCLRVAIKGGPVTTVTVTETVPTGFVLDSIVVEQLTSGVTTKTKLTGVNSASGVLGGNPASGALLVFYNSLDTPPPGGGEGCTPGYWKQSQHFGNWTAPYTPGTLFDDVFDNAFPGMTLLQVVSQGGGGLAALGRHTVAALLNAASPDVDADFTTAEVITAFNTAFASGAYEAQKNIFAASNEQGCDLARAEAGS